MEQDRTPLFDAVTELIETKPAYFRIPGHRLDRGVSPRWTDRVGREIFAYDVTETPLTDDLHCPEGAISEAEALLAKLYGADRSFFLVNGSTCGNEAMILSAAHEGEEIMVARNAHKSAMMGLVLSGARPVYVMPEVMDEWGIQGGVTPGAVRKCFDEHPNCKALFLVSPSYYGVCSDLEEIAKICHAHGALLLVDEAHGGHVYFHNKLPAGALQAGADMCVQSMHKVTGALTQSSVLHVKNHGVRQEALLRVAENLHLVQSTSPSYLLMVSMDCARRELALHGREMMEHALGLAGYARSAINEMDGFCCLDMEAGEVNMTQASGVADIDQTRLVISARELGLTGFDLDKLFFEKYAVNMELADYGNTLAIVTYANEREDMDRLIAACREISKGFPCSGNYKNDEDVINSASRFAQSFPALPYQAMTPRKAFFSKTKVIPWQEAAGEISGQMIAPYPPGVPIIYPGERISHEAWEYIERFRKDGRHMHGGVDGIDGGVRVIE